MLLGQLVDLVVAVRTLGGLHYPIQCARSRLPVTSSADEHRRRRQPSLRPRGHWPRRACGAQRSAPRRFDPERSEVSRGCNCDCDSHQPSSPARRRELTSSPTELTLHQPPTCAVGLRPAGAGSVSHYAIHQRTPPSVRTTRSAPGVRRHGCLIAERPANCKDRPPIRPLQPSP